MAMWVPDLKAVSDDGCVREIFRLSNLVKAGLQPKYLQEYYLFEEIESLCQFSRPKHQCLTTVLYK